MSVALKRAGTSSVSSDWPASVLIRTNRPVIVFSSTAKVAVSGEPRVLTLKAPKGRRLLGVTVVIRPGGSVAGETATPVEVANKIPPATTDAPTPGAAALIAATASAASVPALSAGLTTILMFAVAWPSESNSNVLVFPATVTV